VQTFNISALMVSDFNLQQIAEKKGTQPVAENNSTRTACGWYHSSCKVTELSIYCIPGMLLQYFGEVIPSILNRQKIEASMPTLKKCTIYNEHTDHP
jgi:hypothetical protein